MFFIVVEVFGLERVRFESRPLLHVEVVVLYVGFHAVFGHEAVILFGAIAGTVSYTHLASDYEILTCRLVDRALRPLFPDNFHAEETEERRVGKECRSRWSPYH